MRTHLTLHHRFPLHPFADFRALGRLPPFYLLIRCTTPDGEPIDVAAFASDFPANILPETGDFP